MKEKKVKKTKKRKMHPFIKGFLGCIAVVLVLACGASFVVAGALHGKLNYNEIEEVKREPLKEAGVKNILLIGNDSRSADESGRSDAMILVSISSKTNSIHLTSLLRDIYVDIPGHDGNRLNAAYASLRIFSASCILAPKAAISPDALIASASFIAIMDAPIKRPTPGTSYSGWKICKATLQSYVCKVSANFL